MVLRYTRTRSVDTRPVVSDSRRGVRTSRVSLGEDCNSVTMCLRPCLLVGCIRRRFTGERTRASWEPAAGVTGPAPCSAVRCGTCCTTVWTGLRVPRELRSQETHSSALRHPFLPRNPGRPTGQVPTLPGSGLQQQGHRTFVHRTDLHGCTKSARGDRRPAAAQFGDHLLDQRLGHLGGGGGVPGRTATLSC